MGRSRRSLTAGRRIPQFVNPGPPQFVNPGRRIPQFVNPGRRIPQFVNPGLTPGVRKPCSQGNAVGGNQIRVALELTVDISLYPTEIALPYGSHVAAATPSNHSSNATICVQRAIGFDEPDEITQPSVGTEADCEMHVVCENGGP